MGLGNFLEGLPKAAGRAVSGLAGPLSGVASTVGPALSLAAPEIGIPLTIGGLLASKYADPNAASATGHP
jgi:hypothetical protein